LLTTYAIPALANRKAEAVTRAEVARLHDQLKDKPYQANRLLAVIGSLYTFAERRGLVPESRNPAKKIEKFPEERRERFLTPEELERLGSAIREGETVGIAWREDGTAPKSKHLAKEENQRTFSPRTLAPRFASCSSRAPGCERFCTCAGNRSTWAVVFCCCRTPRLGGRPLC
jgi:integrase